jgi:catechol 2,3-dioxygenase-like lactoylglutathione lyase family enzyme
MPEAHAGRLFDHVHVRVRDVEVSKRFYEGALAALGLSVTGSGTSADGDRWFSVDELFVSEDGEPTSGLHVAFQTPDRETVERFYEAALAAGGRDNGAPGERAYHPGYYGAYVLDPDGNNVEAVYHGPATRSAESVVFTWDE